MGGEFIARNISCCLAVFAGGFVNAVYMLRNAASSVSLTSAAAGVRNCGTGDMGSAHELRKLTGRHGTFHQERFLRKACL
jgi:hypothetical protein